MAKVNIELICNSCGKGFNHFHICRNRTQAESYEEWAKTNITTCPKCFKMFKEAEHETEISKKLEGVELVTLTGTEKQVKWANKIRREAVARIMDRKPNEKFFELVNSKSEAKWWIENRDAVAFSVSFLPALSK